ncbi:uncharacterized protein LOC128856290 [Anastrepha ludens]|uniref:uncharacterized protein LOC128856290 n=1 Tax=Anastrepha ludens TaxID=28586 RepID=UPI0023B1787D|nr:uncharacterized protein LOC128856290 [Anastrepha ludens]
MPKVKNKCVQGCGGGHRVFNFPIQEKDAARHAIWRDRLGVGETHAKYLYACERHFSKSMRLSKKLLADAVPDQNITVTIELGTEHFTPQAAEEPMDACGESGELCLHESISDLNQNLNLAFVEARNQDLISENSKLKSLLEEKCRYICYLKNQLSEVSTKLKNVEKELSDKVDELSGLG